MSLDKNFWEQGFVIAPAGDQSKLIKLRQAIFVKCKEVFAHSGDDSEHFFNNFHQLDIDRADLNEKRMAVIRHCTENIDASGLVYDAFKEVYAGLLGPDLLVQKNVNVVISEPEDLNSSELHSDAPANSYYEVVTWLPLVDTYGTKTLYVLDRAHSEQGLADYGEERVDWAGFVDYAEENGTPAEVPFGSALFFWPGLFHGSLVNREQETRWTLNLRFKNAFTPGGQKDPFGFFKTFRLSPLTRLALEAEKRNLLK
jgi:sporadic carbohydrate cluster 2OG-Fe(II) oxygenase